MSTYFLCFFRAQRRSGWRRFHPGDQTEMNNFIFGKTWRCYFFRSIEYIPDDAYHSSINANILFCPIFTPSPPLFSYIVSFFIFPFENMA